MPAVMQEWTTKLPLREQGVLVLALRGPDGARKEHGAKNVVRALRGCVMVTGATGQSLMPGQNLPDDTFMQMYRIGHPNSEAWDEAVKEFFRAWDEYNVHFLFHLMHAAEVLGYRYPNGETIQVRWLNLYYRSCKKVHIIPESLDQMIDRLKDGHRPDSPE